MATCLLWSGLHDPKNNLRFVDRVIEKNSETWKSLLLVKQNVSECFLYNFRLVL